jgi:hypothetical protein
MSFSIVAPAAADATSAAAPTASAESTIPAAAPAAGSASAAAAKSWGAISVDTGEAPSYGVGGGDTKDEADKNAQKFCGTAGGKNCSTVLSYEQCGAYAASASGAGKGVGATQKSAEAAAISDCKGADCKILTSDCNE